MTCFMSTGYAGFDILYSRGQARSGGASTRKPCPRNALPLCYWRSPAARCPAAVTSLVMHQGGIGQNRSKDDRRTSSPLTPKPVGMLNRIFLVGKLQSCSTYSTMMFQDQCFGLAVSVVNEKNTPTKKKHGRSAQKKQCRICLLACQRAGKMHKSSVWRLQSSV